MRCCISSQIRNLAICMAADEYGNSGYLNVPYYQPYTYPSDQADWVQSGPPSLYNDLDKEDRLQEKNDMRRQGPNPGPVDILMSGRPVTDTIIEGPKTDAQGEPTDNVPGRGTSEDLNRDTIGFNPGEWPRDDVGFSSEQRALYQ